MKKVFFDFFPHWIFSFLGIVIVFLFFQFPLYAIQNFFINLFFQSQIFSVPHPKIQLIQYDEKNQTPMAFPISEILETTQKIAQDKPQAIVVFTSIYHHTYTLAELLFLKDNLEKIPNAYLAYWDDAPPKKEARPLLEQINSSRFVPGFISRDSFQYGSDSVSRRVMLHIEGKPTIFSILSCIDRKIEDFSFCENGRGIESYEAENFQNFKQAYIHWQGNTGTYSMILNTKIKSSPFPSRFFSQKIVLLGAALKANQDKDFVRTPYSPLTPHMTKLEAAANALGSLLYQNQLRKSPFWMDILLTSILVFIAINAVLFLTPARSIVLVVSLFLCLFFFSWICFFGASFWLNLTHPIVCVLTSYYLVIPYRLIQEYRKRWYFQEKTELMTEVEQYKSNFLSLISHDLKTPLARIQTSAELALHQPSLSLPVSLKKTLSEIIETTQEMGEYVNSILDLIRIENAKIPLQKTSKDVNQILQEVVEEKKYLAEQKNISFVLDLEPLFSIQLDEKLIRRVFTNLIENAIKYSEKSTRIRIRSTETDQWISVSFQDQGPGISKEEQEKIFWKFYRCTNTATKNQKGSGLGLYLVKYFVELHHGFIELKSELGKGSVFTVSLPI